MSDKYGDLKLYRVDDCGEVAWVCAETPAHALALAIEECFGGVVDGCSFEVAVLPAEEEVSVAVDSLEEATKDAETYGGRVVLFKTDPPIYQVVASAATWAKGKPGIIASTLV